MSTPVDDPAKRHERVQWLKEQFAATVSDGVNAGTGAAIGAVLGSSMGPAGTLAGAMLGGASGGIAGRFTGAIAHGLADHLQRAISGEQATRVEEATAWGAAEIEWLLGNGAEARAGTDQDQSAKEIFEGAVAIARDSYEAKRVRHLGMYFARFAFAPGIDAAQGHHLLRIAQQLSYRQMCLLRVLSGRDKHLLVNFDFRDRARGAGRFPFDPDEPRSDLLSLLQEALDLAGSAKGLLERSDESTFLDWSDINPHLMRHTAIGRNLEYLLGMEYADAEDIRAILDLFNRSGALWSREDGPPPHLS